MAGLSSALTYFTYSFMEPILVKRLSEFSLQPVQIGLFFAIWPLVYIPASVLVQYFPSTIQKRVIIFTACTGMAFSFFFVGPSQLLHFPDSLALMGIG